MAAFTAIATGVGLAISATSAGMSFSSSKAKKNSIKS